MKKFLITLLSFSNLIWGYGGEAFSQNQQLVDSLQIDLKNAKQDTTKTNILYQLSRAYWNSSSEKAMDYANQTLALAVRIDYKKGIGNAYNSLGVINGNQGKFSQALDFYKKSLKVREEINDQQGVGWSFNNIGIIFFNQSNYPEALKYYTAALKIRQRIDDKQGLATSYHNIGNINAVQGSYPAALKYYLTALKIREEIGDKNGIADSYSTSGAIYDIQGNYTEALKNHFAALKIREEIGSKIGMIASYNNIGIAYKGQGNYPEALKNHFACLKIAEEIGDMNGLQSAYNNTGIIYDIQGNYTQALKNYFAALKIQEEIEDQDGAANSYNNIGDIYTKLKNYHDAAEYLNKGLSLAKETGSPDRIANSYYGLSILDSARGDYKQALENYKLYIVERDSMFNDENTKKLVQTQMQYDFDRKEAVTKAEQEKKDAIAQKELQRQMLVRNGFIGGFVVVLLFAGVFFNQRNSIKKGKKRSDELLLNILPEEVAEELKAKGSADAKQFDDVTVMFTDFKGFTQISEKLSPAELVAEIHYCFKAFDNIITKHKIEKIKTIGDAYMCAGGLPVSNTTHAGDVVKAALEIQQFMLQHLQQRSGEGKEIFEIRIGLHTGPVVAGIVGVKKFAYDIWGDTVNIASRMESSGEAGKVNISGSTYALVKDQFNCTHRGKIQAKNKGEIDMYFVERSFVPSL